MTQIIRSIAPVRVLDIGGWTDTAFAGHGAILNFSVNLFAHVIVKTRNNQRIIIHAPDMGKSVEVKRVQDIEYDGTLDLLKAAVKRMNIKTGIEAKVWSDTPPGCGVGTSAAVAVALLEALNHLTKKHLPAHAIAQLAQALETEELKISCGLQDQISAAYGGILFMEIDEYPNVKISPVRLPREFMAELSERLILVYTGQSRLSDAVHQRVITELKAKVPKTVEAMKTLRQTPYAMKNALMDGNFRAIAKTINRNWQAQKDLHPSITTPKIEEAFRVAFKHGAVAGKANGAGGGGSVIFLCEAGTEFDVRQALGRVKNLSLLPCNICLEGSRSWFVT